MTEYKTTDELNAMTAEELVTYNQSLMVLQDEIQERKLEVKAELDCRTALAKLEGLTDAQKRQLAERFLAATPA
ncbi:MAG: hypothetical protein K8U57_07470 [Planctomycetes bacterium]|nr:hypothetical protein [Planctomycetota bacterium]